jgi:hypothetical protein
MIDNQRNRALDEVVRVLQVLELPEGDTKQLAAYVCAIDACISAVKRMKTIPHVEVRKDLQIVRIGNTVFTATAVQTDRPSMNEMVLHLHHNNFMNVAFDDVNVGTITVEDNPIFVKDDGKAMRYTFKDCVWIPNHLLSGSTRLTFMYTKEPDQETID